MSDLLWVDEEPIRKRLHQDLENLAKQLATLEKTVEEYFSRDLPQYHSWVNNQYAEELIEVAALEKRISTLGRHVDESIQISVQNKIHPEDLFKDFTEEEFFSKVLSEEEPEESQEGFSLSQRKEKPSEASKEIYRRIVRHLHPDIRGKSLSDEEKNLWVKAQGAYAKNNVFELERIEQKLRSGDLSSEMIACSELIRQLKDFQNKREEIQKEILILKKEKAWRFALKRSVSTLERDMESELKNRIKDLRFKEDHYSNTLRSWLQKQESKPKTQAKPKKRSHKSQTSLF